MFSPAALPSLNSIPIVSAPVLAFCNMAECASDILPLQEMTV